MINEKLRCYMQLMRLDKPIGILLLLWPTLWALWLAAYQQGQIMPELSVLAVFVMGVILMRSAGCVINDYADKDFDIHVKRTASRPLAVKAITIKEAKGLFFLLVLFAFLLVLTQNRLTIGLSFIAVLLASCYPFMKRVTHLPQLVLGLAYGCSIPMAYAAVMQQLPMVCWLLFIANLCWVVAYDTQYAMVDRDDDLKIGIKSTAILFGRHDRLIIALLQLFMLILLVAVGFIEQLTDAYYATLLIVLCLFFYQQKLITERDRQACFRAFLHNNYIGMIIFCGILLN